MPSKEYQAFLDVMKGSLVDAGDSTEVARAKLEAVHGHPIKPGTRVDWIESGPVRRTMTEDCVGGYLALIASEIAPARAGFVGDSCGGGPGHNIRATHAASAHGRKQYPTRKLSRKYN
jgi:hypothetical protein